MTRTVGDGNKIKFWTQNWGHGLLYTVYPILFGEAKEKDISVHQMFQIQNISEMFHHVVSDEFTSQLAELEAFVQPPFQFNMNEDDAVWALSDSGSFTVRSTYHGLLNVPRIATRVHRIWKLKFSQD